MGTELNRLPRLGAGLGYRAEIARPILENCEELPGLEILADRLLRGSDRDWEEVLDLSRIFRLIPHGVNLSVGSADCLKDRAYLKALQKLSRRLDFPYYSDHFAFTKSGGRDIGHLTPLWRTRKQLEVVVRNARAVQELLGRPLVLETITEPLKLPGGDIPPADFLNEAARRTGCGLLLDLTNVFINGSNGGFDPQDFLKSLDLSAVVQLHLAGGVREDGAWIDTHSAPVPGPVWSLLKSVLPRCPNLKAVIIERDSHFPPIGQLLSEVRRVRRLWEDA